MEQYNRLYQNFFYFFHKIYGVPEIKKDRLAVFNAELAKKVSQLTIALQTPAYMNKEPAT